MCPDAVDDPGASGSACGHGVAFGCPDLPVENHDFAGAVWSARLDIKVGIVVKIRTRNSGSVRCAGTYSGYIKSDGCDSGRSQINREQSAGTTRIKRGSRTGDQQLSAARV